MAFTVVANQSTKFDVSLGPKFVPSAYSNLILSTSGLRHYYQCDETSGSTLSDSKGNENLTTGGSFSLTTAGLIAGDLATCFDTTAASSGSATGTGHTQIGGGGDFTFEAWFVMTSGSSNVFMLGEGSGVSANQVVYIGMAAGKPRIFVRNNASVAADVTSTGSAFNDGEHHYIAMVGTRSTNTINLYVDNLGVQVTSSAYPTGAYGLNQFSIGSLFSTTNGSQAYAKYAHVATYDTALIANTLTQHYIAGVAAKMAFYNF